MCCSPWGRKELDTTEQLNWTEPSTNLPLLCYWLWEWKLSRDQRERTIKGGNMDSFSTWSCLVLVSFWMEKTEKVVSHISLSLSFSSSPTFIWFIFSNYPLDVSLNPQIHVQRTVSLWFPPPPTVSHSLGGQLPHWPGPHPVSHWPCGLFLLYFWKCVTSFQLPLWSSFFLSLN